MFDFSNYSTKSKYYDDSSKSVIGKMEDETSGVVIEEFVGLKAKIYSYCMSEDGRKRNWTDFYWAMLLMRTSSIKASKHFTTENYTQDLM